MTPRAAIQQLGKMVRQDLQSGAFSAGALDVGDMLAEQPDALLLIVDVTATEARKRQPDDRLCQAYGFMLGETLERLRQRAEAGQAFGAIAIDQARTRIARQIADGKLPLDGAMALTAAFTRSGIDLGDAIRSALDAAMVRGAHQGADAQAPDPATMLTALAEACDHDPFMIHTEFATMIAATPPEVQVSLLDVLVRSDAPELREAAVGWLLAEPAIAMPMAKAIEAAAKQGLVSASSVAHLVIMRNWVPDDQRPEIDAIIRAARVKASPAEKRPSIQIRELLISERDGAGAQSVFASVKQGREHALVSILIKQNHGIRDAWVASSLSRSEADDMVIRITTEMPHHEATAEDAVVLVSAALADAAAVGATLPFGLVQAVALLALTDVAPAAMPVADLITSLLAEADPAVVTEHARSKAVRASGQWIAYNPNVQSWFENGDEVAAARKGKRKKADRVAAIIEEVLEPHRTFWAQVVAWSAFACRSGGGDTDWVGMALVAQELARDRPLIDIPLATFIAVQTEAAAS